MAILRGLLVLFVLFGSIPSGNTQNVTDETTVAEDTTTEAVTSVTTETSTAMEADTTESSTNVTVAMVTNATTTVMMTTTAEMETEQTTMETTTMYIPMTTLAPIILTNCTHNDNCTASNSVCNTTLEVCQCKDTFVLVNDTICRSVNEFKAMVTLKNVTDNSILVDWTTVDISGVDVYYEVIFNITTLPNITSPPQLITNLSNGEVQSIQVTSIVKGRDDRIEIVMSDVSFIRTAPLTPEFNITPYEAPNVTIIWTPRNPDVDLYYIYLKGHDNMSIPNSTNETSLSLTDLKPGRSYMFTVIQQTNGPYASNSSEATLNIRTESTVPGPPVAVEVVDVGQRNISINVTDTDMPNGDIIGYLFHIMYKLYPDEKGYIVKVKLLKNMNSNIYVLERHIYPGAQYKIAVFTVNDAFNSSLNVTLQDITTLPDTPGQVDVHTPSYNNQTIKSAVILWDRPSHPNGNMKAYRAVLESGPNITNCRIYYLCFDVCNNTLLGPPNDTCTISNDTTVMEHQKRISLLVDNLRLGTTYRLSVVGYNEAGEGKIPRLISLTTKSIKPDPVKLETFNIDTSSRVVTWTSPPFPGDDLKYSVSLEDALKGGVLSRSTTSASSFNIQNRLYNYYNYTVVVVAHTSAGSATPSRYPFTTSSAGKLGAPQGPKIIEYTCERIKITWFEPDVRTRNGPITGYKFKNKDGNEVWTYTISRPEYWATQSKQFTHDLNIKQLTSYFIEMYAFSSISNQEGNIFTIRKFQSTECPKDNTPEIVGIVFAFLILLGICLAVIIFVYRKKVREIEETYTNGPNVRPVQGDGGITPIPDEEIELNRPFILSDAQKAFEEKSADSNRLFLMEYDDIKKLSQIEGRKRTTNAANIDANKAKNRYVNILSYDHSRVKLRMIDDDPCSDYVNANYIIGYTYEREYIASQGPLPGTVNDFWRMTWEQSVTIIVMLTKCKEGNTNEFFGLEDKCEHYWPDTVNEPKQYGDIVVNLISVSNMDKFDINIFQVSQGDYTRTIKHFHFLEWPDFSAAVDSTVVIDFIQTVRTHITPEVKGPLLIHCSAGVGRTGTYITIDYLLQFVRDHDLGQSVDIFAWVVQMRKNRVSMVQVDKQYIFIHRALTELIDRKRNGLLQSQDDTTILNEIVYENTAFQSDDDEEEEEEEDEDEEADAMYENSMKKVPDEHTTEL
ncbi:tyrosine-protein phosphatase 10D-like isoform X2 [Crassostrea angulata]|uniref:tyrosine-protein phosphatase 10D-like isoform X2 n=1 Tax=Magallana angulata TaxID=2784310 RepID=UPI0022B16168|nr:tyrosine-protein phosphatase 10D-like isoform X2 [Crassostrea angulata]